MEQNEQTIKKQYLIRMLNDISAYDIGQEIYETTFRLEQRGNTPDEAKRRVLEKYKQVLHRDNVIVNTILEFDKALYDLFQTDINGNIKVDETINEGEAYQKEYIEWISSNLCGLDYTVADNKLIDDPKGFIKEIREVYIAREIVQSLNREKERVTNKPTNKPIKIPDDILNELKNAKLITKEPMKWVGSISLCAYFVDSYFATTNPNDLWEVGQTLFNVRNLSQSKYNYLGNKSEKHKGKPRNYQIIDAILKKHR